MSPHHESPEDRDQRDRLERLAARILGHREAPPTPRPAPCVDCNHATRRRHGPLPLCEPCYSHRALQARLRAELAAIFDAPRGGGEGPR